MAKQTSRDGSGAPKKGPTYSLARFDCECGGRFYMVLSERIPALYGLGHTPVEALDDVLRLEQEHDNLVPDCLPEDF
jgi:hypothetical protein